MSNNGLKSNYRQRLKLTLVHYCNSLKRLQDQLKVLTSYKIIRLILQPLAFHYITHRLFVLSSLFSYIYIQRQREREIEIDREIERYRDTYIYRKRKRETERQRETEREENCRNYNIKLPRIFILSLLIVSPLHKDPQTI